MTYDSEQHHRRSIQLKGCIPISGISRGKSPSAWSSSRSSFRRNATIRGLIGIRLRSMRLVARQESFQGAWRASLKDQLVAAPDFSQVFAEVTLFLQSTI